MAQLLAAWPLASGNEPPPPQTPDVYKLVVKYRGGWKRSLDATEAGTSYSFGEQPAGEYTVRVYGMYDGEMSAAYSQNTIILTEGDLVDPEYGTAPSGGNSGIAAPGSLDLTSM